MKNILSCILVLIFVSACSVAAAASGQYEPDMNTLQPGITRSEVHSELGDPISRSDLPGGGSKETFVYKMGDEPAPARALMHLCLYVVTLCLWEYIGFPMEISMSGNAYEMDVHYDRDNKATYFKISEEAAKPEDQES